MKSKLISLMRIKNLGVLNLHKLRFTVNGIHNLMESFIPGF